MILAINAKLVWQLTPRSGNSHHAVATLSAYGGNSLHAVEFSRTTYFPVSCPSIVLKPFSAQSLLYLVSEDAAT